MIKAVIFDFFGVFTVTDRWQSFKSKYFGDNEKLLERLTKLNNDANSGLIDYKKFLYEVAQITGKPVKEIQSDIESSKKALNIELLDYIKTLKPNYRLGILSNTSRNMLEGYFTQEEIDLFDAVLLSYKEGLIKPNLEAYQKIAKKAKNCTSKLRFY